jgi:hypothetical protein
MIAPMMKRERRQTPRMTVEPLAYINLEPDNGGIILNVSEGGLCFHSTAPVQQRKSIHFWFSVRYHRIEGDGDLAWADETQKKCGLRFTNLPPEAREQIRSWMSLLATPLPVEENAALSLPLSHEIRSLSTNQREIGAARDRSARPEGPSPETKAFRLLSGFSGGLVSGLLVSTLLAAVFLLHSYRRQLGESLIQLGERLEAKSQPQAVPPPMQAAPAQALTVSPAPITAPRPGKRVPEPVTSVVKSQPVKFEAAKQINAAPLPRPRPMGKPAAISPAPPPVSLPTLAVGRRPPVLPGVVTQIEIAKPASKQVENSRGGNARSISQMYFEVGKFKENLRAHKTSDELKQLGFPAEVIQKGHLWTNSYYVLVGPYAYDEEAEVAHKNLLSHGFKARAFERGSRNFVLRPGLTLSRTQMPAGEVEVSWESYVTDAKVKFVQRNDVVATAEGRWVKSGVRYDNGAVVYVINADGSRTLLQIQFAGMDRALVFGKSS